VEATRATGLATAGLFEALTLVATQDKTVRAASPWQDDPYDAVVSLTQFAVPMLALAVGLRLLARRAAPESPDREQQIRRAVGAMIALVGLTAVFEWAAVAARAHAPGWNAWTAVLIAGLAVVSALTGTTVLLLVRRRAPRGSARRWRDDWLGDVVLVAQRIPGLRRWTGPALVAWVRRRALTVFVALSVLAAAAVVGVLAVGERWTDPLLIGWALLVATTSYIAFCLISNAVAGFIARPPRTRRRQVAERSLLAGCIAIQVVTAFRDAIWSPIAGAPVSTVATLAALTAGAGVLAAAITAGVLGARSSA